MKTEPTDAMRERIKGLFEINAEDVAAIEANARRNEIIALAAFKKGQSYLKIKQLEWIEDYGYIQAETPFFKYLVPIIGKKASLCFGGNEGFLMFDTVDDAKAAAQAHFEKRVMECLDS